MPRETIGHSLNPPFLEDVKRVVEVEFGRVGFSGYEPLGDFLESYKNCYFSPVNFQGNRCFIKVLLKSGEEREEHFFREIEVNQDFTTLFQSGFPLVPKLILVNTSHRPYWMLQEFIEGSSLGGFHPCPETLKPEYIKPLIELVDKIRSFSLERLWLRRGLSNVVKVYDFQGYKTAIEKYQYPTFENAGEIYEAIHQLLRENRDLLDSSASFLIHGDFQPKNIILTPQKEFKAVDWEHFSINNPTYDIAFLWMHTYSHPQWRRQLLAEYRNSINSGGFDSLFRIAILRFATRKISKNELRGTPLPEEVKRVYLGDIKRALESFESLTGLPESPAPKSA